MNQEFQEEKNRLVRAPHPHLLLQMVFVKMRPWRPKAKMRRWKPSNFILKPAHCVIYSNPVFLTGFFVLWSSSCVLQNSCSKEVASSLNKPTSSQFFRKRVGVGVWSAKKQKKLSVLVDKNITFRHRLLYTIHLFRALTTSSAQINLKKDKWRCHYLQW